jgi:hypothetical protein
VDAGPEAPATQGLVVTVSLGQFRQISGQRWPSRRFQ